MIIRTTEAGNHVMYGRLKTDDKYRLCVKTFAIKSGAQAVQIEQYSQPFEVILKASKQ